MSGSQTFDVLVLSEKAQWTSISRWPDATAAQNEARKLIAGKKHLGVKVSQETFDHAENRFKEKTLFKHLKNDGDPKVPAAASRSATAAFDDDDDDYDDDEYDEFDDFDDYDDDGIDWVAPVFGLFAALAIILTLGIFFFDGKVDIGNSASSSSSSNSDYFIFDLPAAITNVSSGNEQFSVRIDLKLELDESGDAEAVELRLAQIMESVISEIQTTDAGDLKRSEKILLLRSNLKQKSRTPWAKQTSIASCFIVFRFSDDPAYFAGNFTAEFRNVLFYAPLISNGL